MRQLGVNVLWENSAKDDDVVTRAKARRTLNYLIGLNVNSVALNFPFAMKGARASAVQPEEHTPSPQRLAIFLKEAQASRMRVNVRPILDEETLITAWRGRISPADRDAWFASYTAFLVPYARTAQEHRAAELTVGVELNSLQADPRWAKLIADVRAHFSGAIGYSANFDEYQKGSPVPPVDGTGVDAYSRINVPDSASVATLTQGWNRWIERYAGARAPKLVLHEVGVPAQNGAYRKPGGWGSRTVALNLAVQANWYQAVCNAARQQKIAGLYFWNLRLHHNPGHENPAQADRLTFVDRPAQEVLRNCYARMSTQ
jgi:hypothetical protein